MCAVHGRRRKHLINDPYHHNKLYDRFPPLAGLGESKVVKAMHDLAKDLYEKKDSPPSHTFSHSRNGANVVAWYLRKGRCSNDDITIGKTSYFFHDICKDEPDHSLKGADATFNLLNQQFSPSEVGEIYFAIAHHNLPKINRGSRSGSVIADAVLFADRMETLGAYGVFRICTYAGEQARKSSSADSIESQVEKEISGELRYSKVLGVYDGGQPLSTAALPFADFFPAQVLPPYIEGIDDTEFFLAELNQGKPWTKEVSRYFYKKGQKNTGELNSIILDFKPKTKLALHFKQKAIDYMDPTYW